MSTWVSDWDSLGRMSTVILVPLVKVVLRLESTDLPLSLLLEMIVFFSS